MSVASVFRRWSVPLLTALLLVGGARQAGAQGFISPFAGYNFGGDAGCPDITNCKDKHGNYGVSFGALGKVVGVESEFGYTNDFFGNTSNQSTKMWTFMGNFMLAPKFGPVQPYGVAGVGLMRTELQTPGQKNDQNQIGYDLGGGLIGYFSRHVGVRGDVRYFHSFQVLDFSKIPGLPAGVFTGEPKVNFGRFSLAVIFKF